MTPDLQFVHYKSRLFYLPEKLEQVPEAENLGPLPKIRRRSALISVLAIEGEMLWLRMLMLYCRGCPPPWQEVFPVSVLTEDGWAWVYRLRLLMRFTGVLIGHSEDARAVFALKAGKVLAAHTKSSEENGPSAEGPRWLS